MAYFFCFWVSVAEISYNIYRAIIRTSFFTCCTTTHKELWVQLKVASTWLQSLEPGQSERDLGISFLL